MRQTHRRTAESGQKISLDEMPHTHGFEEYANGTPRAQLNAEGVAESAAAKELDLCPLGEEDIGCAGDHDLRRIRG